MNLLVLPFAEELDIDAWLLNILPFVGKDVTIAFDFQTRDAYAKKPYEIIVSEGSGKLLYEKSVAHDGYRGGWGHFNVMTFTRHKFYFENTKKS